MKGPSRKLQYFPREKTFYQLLTVCPYFLWQGENGVDYFAE